MKTKSFLISAIPFVIFIFLSFKTPFVTSQEIFEVIAVYDSHEDYGYNFTSKNNNDDEITLTFHEVEQGVLDNFDLNSDQLLGIKFKISYTSKIIVTKDADGYEDEDEVNTIVKLEKL